MKTTTLILFFAMFLGTGTAQETESLKFFGQCMVNITDEQMFRELETELRANPFIEVARLDWNTKRAFILTKNLDAFNDVTFTAWFGGNAMSITCIQTGVYGVDQMKPYPFENCQN